MRILLSYCLIFVFVIQIDAQVNLVPNPSFEVYTSCPTGASQISLATPWQGVTTNSTDYWNSCAVMGSGISVPSDGGGGFQFARTGSAYAGIWAYMGCYYYREYMQVKLDSVLELDSCYYVEFYCNLYNQSYYGINKMAAALSNTAISSTISGPGSTLVFTPQIVSNQFIIDTLNWVKVSGYYKANGGEQYITIGNFDTCTNTDTLGIGSGSADAYYLIDDVTVKKVVGCDTTLGVHEISNAGPLFDLYPNPNNGNMVLKYSLKSSDKAEMRIYDITGKLINKLLLNTSTNQMIINEDLLNGIYFYQIIVNDKIVKSDKLVIIK